MTHCELKWPVETFTVALHTFRDCKSRFISPSAAPVLPGVVFVSVAAVVLVSALLHSDTDTQFTSVRCHHTGNYTMFPPFMS